MKRSFLLLWLVVAGLLVPALADKKNPLGPDSRLGGLIETTAEGSEGKMGYDPVVGVEITLQGTQFKAISDERGYFHFDDIPNAEYTLICKKPGYPTVTKAVKVDAIMPATVRLIMNPEDATMVGDAPAGPGTVYVAYGQRQASQARNGPDGSGYMLDSKRTMQGALAAGADPLGVGGNAPPEMKGMDYQGNPTTDAVNSLMVFPPTAPARTAFTTLATQPYWLCFNRSGSTVYISSTQNMVMVLDAAHENRLMRNIPTTGRVTDLVATPDGRYILAGIMAASSGIMVIDTKTNDPVAFLSTPTPPRAVAMNGPRAFAAVGETTWGAVLVLDSATGVQQGKIPVGSNPTGMALSPDGRYLYVVNSGSASVSVLDALTMAEVTKISVGINPQKVAISPDGKRAFVTNKQNDTVSTIDTKSLGVINTEKVGAGPIGVAVTRDSTKCFVTCKDAGTLVMLDGNTGKAIHTTVPPPNSSPWGVAIRP